LFFSRSKRRDIIQGEKERERERERERLCQETMSIRERNGGGKSIQSKCSERGGLKSARRRRRRRRKVYSKLTQ